MTSVRCVTMSVVRRCTVTMIRLLRVPFHPSPCSIPIPLPDHRTTTNHWSIHANGTQSIAAFSCCICAERMDGTWNTERGPCSSMLHAPNGLPTATMLGLVQNGPSQRSKFECKVSQRWCGRPSRCCRGACESGHHPVRTMGAVPWRTARGLDVLWPAFAHVARCTNVACIRLVYCV